MDGGHIRKQSQKCGEKLLDVLTALLDLFKLGTYYCPARGRIVYTLREYDRRMNYGVKTNDWLASKTLIQRKQKSYDLFFSLLIVPRRKRRQFTCAWRHLSEPQMQYHPPLPFSSLRAPFVLSIVPLLLVLFAIYSKW